MQLDAFFGGAALVQATEKARNRAVTSFIFVVMLQRRDDRWNTVTSYFFSALSWRFRIHTTIPRTTIVPMTVMMRTVEVP